MVYLISAPLRSKATTNGIKVVKGVNGVNGVSGVSGVKGVKGVKGATKECPHKKSALGNFFFRASSLLGLCLLAE